jgi:uncharacterized protein (TIGR02186 family)
MRKKSIITALGALVLLLAAWPAPAGSQGDMVTDRSKKAIEVDVRFHGERIYFFGTVPDPEAELVVKLVPKKPEPIKLMRKGRVVLFWMGVKQFEVHNMPYLYKIHSSKPLKEIITPELARQYRLDYRALKDDMKLELLKGEPSDDDRDLMFDGFIQLKEEQNLYRVAENRIRVTKGRLFEHYFTFPDKAKAGEYLVESYAIKDGKVIDHSSDVVQVRKVGLTAWLYEMAQEQGVLYGLMAVGIALVTGLLVGMVFKGGGH